MYSNIGYLFVRRIIERAADADLNEALRTLVFDPLGIEGVFVANTHEEFDAIVWSPDVTITTRTRLTISATASD